MKNLTLFILCALFAMVGCKQDKNKAAATPATKVCGYVYDNLSTKVEWTAYKFTNKTPVGGTFKSFVVKANDGALTPEAFVKAMTFSVDAASIDSKNEVRDGRILQHFFGLLSSGTKITGFVKSIQDNKALTSITFNGVTKEVPLDYSFVDNTITLSGSIDVADWGGSAAINALNTVCKDLHTGTDGKSKLWSEVAIKITSKLEKTNC